jgi:hypothetical protein
MKYGKKFTKYMNTFPNAAKPSANRCSALPYNELKAMAKNIYHNNRDAKVELYKYQNMPKNELVNSVFRALDTLK